MKLQINARNRAHHCQVGAGESMLYAGLASAVDLPYECASGTCGTCKARLVSGEIRDTWPEAPGRKYLKGRDEFLMCQCEPKGDAVIEVASFVQTMEAGACVPAFQGGRIAATRMLTADVMMLDVDIGQPMDFDAGQFVLVRLPEVPGFRGWSMVNYERGARSLRFVVKKKPGGGLSERLFNGKVEGAAVDVFGPLGKATFYPSMGKNILCIAGGSGIAGMMSILQRAAQDGYFTQYSGHVYFGVRTFRDAFLLDELAGLREQCGEKLNVTVAFSDEPVADAAREKFPLLQFETGQVHEVARKAMAGRYQNVRAYVAGPPPCVDACIRVLLLEAKLTTDNIRYDKFS